MASGGRASEGDAELEDVEPAEIDEQAGEEPETPFEKLVAASRSGSRPSGSAPWSRALLFVADKPLALDQLYEATGIERRRRSPRRWRSSPGSTARA